ncbi:MAG: Maf family protein [Deltaproteobacteria bacterium]|nr:Maf family protein [Deltaproteobacteria bacterium]
MTPPAASQTPARFILASASPRRRAMLDDLGASFEILPAGIDEHDVPGERAEDHVQRLALEKAETIAAAHPDALVLGVDTEVIVNGTTLGKPADEDDACRMLGLIAGREHTVATAYALVWTAGDLRRTRVVTSRVTLCALTSERIRRYVATGEPMDKAGAYAIQGVGASLVRRVEGSYTCVVGLPLAELVEDLDELFGADWIFEKR